jgi:hypothetical protein
MYFLGVVRKWIEGDWNVIKLLIQKYTGYFTSDNAPDGIENATHNTFGM